MSGQLFQRLEKFRKRQGLSILTLCRQLGAHNVTYHRWKKANAIKGPYKTIVKEFLEKNESHQAQSSLQITSDIAVIGIACYYPGASNVKELWENILARRIQFRRMLNQRLPLSEYYDSDPKSTDKTYLTKAALLENFKFDWAKLRIPKKTFESTDIVHWLALDTALKAFEDAGYKTHEIPLQNTGVVVGNTLTGEQTRSQTIRLRWPYVQKVLRATFENLGINQEEQSRFSSLMEKIYKSAFYPITEDSLAGGLSNTIAGRICNYLNLKGGGYAVDGACSSSLLAVTTAANALKMREMDLVLAGGVDVSLDPFELVGFARAGALAKEKMHVYDKRANGFLPGEGCGFVVLKRLEDAVKDHNNIYAVIKGWGISSDGKGGIMEPSTGGQATAILRAYKNLPYKMSDVDFIEGHGTGTAKGDRVELEGMATALEKSGNKNGKRICGVTSFKSIVGHTKAAAGVGGLIKAVLAVNQRVLPPTANCREPHQIFEGTAKSLYPVLHGAVFSPDKIMRAGISSAGFGGINCHVAIESKDKPSDKIKPHTDESALFVSNQETELFVFTSRTTAHAVNIIRKFKEDLRHISVAEMADLAALLNTKIKNHLPIRIAIIADSPEHFYEALNLIEKELEHTPWAEGQIRRIKTSSPITHIILGNAVKKDRIGFLYPGQGSQRLNMTRRLTERFKWARELLNLSKIPIGEYIYKATDKFLSREEQKEFEKQLAETQITQPAVVFSSLVWDKFLSKLGIEPIAVGGHSLGELAAFYKAGAFNEETLLKFAELRGKLMATTGHTTGSMVSLSCPLEKAKELLGKAHGNIVIANINSPHQIVVSGGNKEIEDIIRLAGKENILTFRLNVSNAFHSSFMDVTSEKIKSAAFLNCTFKSHVINLFSGTDGGLMADKVYLLEYFSKQILAPVNFIRIVESMSKVCDILIEVGPGRVLTDLVKAINKNNEPFCLPVESMPENDRDLNVVLAELFIRNVKIHWQELYKNRLIRLFVPVSRKKFIENQCERPLKRFEQSGKPADFKITSMEHVIDLVKDTAHEDQAKVSVPIQDGKDNIADLLIDLIEKMTGFEKKSISMDLRLLDDLNLDSIKAAELIAEAGKRLGLIGQIDPSQYSNQTLTQIRDRFVELKSRVSKDASALESGDNILKRYQNKTWVRDFVVKFEEEEIKEKDSGVLRDLKNVDILCDESTKTLASNLKHTFKNNVQIQTFSEVDKIETKSNFDCLICLLPAEHSNKPFDENNLEQIIERFYQIVMIAAGDGANRQKTIVFVQFGGGNFGESSVLRNIESGCAKSFASTLHLERPDLKVRVVDFAENIQPNVISRKIVDELQTKESFSAAGYDKSLKRRVPVFQNTTPALYKNRNIGWSSKDVVLVTGGAKGITAECALEFARNTKTRMILIGRSPIPKGKDQDNEILRTLNRFKEEKLPCEYYSCDITNYEELQKTIRTIEKEFGRITAVIHGAGLNTLKRLKQTNPGEAYSESLPKVIGAINVCKALENNSLKLFAGITSVIGVTGMEGSGWYGLANEILNLFLHQFKSKHKKTEVLTVAYSVWDEVGMGMRLGSLNWLSQKGISSIPIQEGVKRFMRLIEQDSGYQQTIVVARIAGIDTWRSPQTEHRKDLRFIEDIKYCMPGVELIAQAHLNVKDDSYVLDHNWKGSLLFPFVFGLEAMTQAVSFLTNADKFDYLNIKDIHLDRPIPVNKETGTTIEIRAEILESEEASSHKKIKVEIYCEQTAFKEPHFSAIFELDGKIQIKNEKERFKSKLIDAINITPLIDLYGPILFQGKLFQCINKIYELFYDEKAQHGKCWLTIDYNKSVEQFLRISPRFNNRLFIGDPFFIDSILQSMQLIITPHMALPDYIEEISLSLVWAEKIKEQLIKASVHKTAENIFLGSTDIKEKEVHICNIKNCRFKVIQYLNEAPNANDLVDPTERDQAIIESRVNELAQQMGFTIPIVRCLYDTRLKISKKRERHKIETPLIQSTVRDLLRRENKKPKSVKVGWLKSGRPVLLGKELDHIKISLSHCDSLLICVAGYGEQGCDIENIVKRSEKDWFALLGQEKFTLQKNLIALGFDSDFSGTVVWSASEAFKKLLNKSGIDFRLSDYYKNRIIFRNVKDNSKISICSMPIEVTCGPVKIFSCSIIAVEEPKNIENKVDIDIKTLRKIGFNEDQLFGVNIDYSGPQKQLVMTQRFPVTFKTNQMLSRRVYFTNFFDWIGTIREYSVYPTFRELAKLAESGEWGLVTNMTELKILGGIKSNDIVEAKIWGGALEGNKNATAPMAFEWFRITDGGRRERVAVALQKSTWVNIREDHSVVIERMPKFLGDYLDLVRPRTEEIFPRESCPEPYRNINLGKIIKSYSRDIVHKFKIDEGMFSTTLENSNIVGNIYFANYARWLGAVGDRFFYNLIPSYFLNVTDKNEIICLECNIYYLNDAFPFENILVEMYLDEMYENGLRLYFEFHRIKEGKKETKLAYANQKIVFANWSNEIEPDVTKVPGQVREFIKSRS